MDHHLSNFSLISFELSYNCISQYAISCQFGHVFICLSITIHIDVVKTVKIRNNTLIIQYLILFCLYSFFVKLNLNKNTTKNIVSINNSIEKIIIISFDTKSFISFKFIPRERKNSTSSTVFAFNAINHKKVHHNISDINAIAHKNHSI
jgi:hypothetical protein